jgi:hypothetical protein
MSRSGAGLLLGIVSIVFACGCADPPEKEIRQAESAIDTAKAAGAERYAVDQLSAAQAALRQAREAVQERDYCLALNHALDSRDEALSAGRRAAGRAAAAQRVAHSAIAAAASALNDLHVRLKAAEAARPPSRILAGPRRAIADAEARLQEARTAIATDDFTAAQAAATRSVAASKAAASSLGQIGPAGARRRR